VNRLRVFENKMHRKIFRPKRDAITGKWRRIHSDELHEQYDSPNITGVKNSRKMKYVHPHRFWRPHSLVFGGPLGFFPGVKRLSCEVKHPPSSGVEVKNKWGYTSTPPVCVTRCVAFQYASRKH
jgi:hypothetical protein